ncbi:MAG: selenocysteine-specific translation elongation factor [Anaerolineaceae bacterium]
MHIVGTAGHVDHGKSTLVAALTGVHPDRLKEEITREMTIDLGFSSLTLPSGELVGIIDVPGHRDFIGNMLSGIGGIDAVLLLIAADEGVSAQTREHLAILDLLQIKKGLIVLTKTDLVSDPEWLELVELEAHELIRNTCLEQAPIVRVSAKTGSGLPELLQTLEHILAETPARRDIGKPRLPVDRVFTLTGFGTIVTGTLLDGSFSVGDEVVCLPSNLPGRIRGLQNHNQKLQKVSSGFRTAININGLTTDQIDRGNVIAHPGSYLPTRLLDVHFRYLQNLSMDFKHNTEVKLYLGASETTAKARLLGVESLKPGEEGFLQLKLTKPVVAVRGDRFILRLPSPSETLGGGQVLDPHPQKLHRRFASSALEDLEKILAGSEADLLLGALASMNYANASAVIQRSGMGEQSGLELISELKQKGEIVSLQENANPLKSLLTTKEGWQEISSQVTKALSEYHLANPLKPGLGCENLRAQLKLPQLVFDASIDQLSGLEMIAQSGTMISLRSHQVKLTAGQQALAAPLLEKFSQSPYTPPSYAESSELVGQELVDGLIASGELVRISDQILLSPVVYKEMADWVKQIITTNGSLSLAELRDYFQTSRKYAAALLEHLDSIGITVRKGDSRVLRRVQS